jgi:hypothetical protein
VFDQRCSSIEAEQSTKRNAFPKTVLYVTAGTAAHVDESLLLQLPARACCRPAPVALTKAKVLGNSPLYFR